MLRARLCYSIYPRSSISSTFLPGHSVRSLASSTTGRKMATTVVEKASAERTSELLENLAEIKARVQQAAPSRQPTLVAVSKYKPAADVLACYEEAGQLDFGENYVQELSDKAQQLPSQIRWHFIGTLQSNKAKILAAIPNLYAIQTLTSAKAATGLNNALPVDRAEPLNILLQVNTSGEDSKSGLSPLQGETSAASSDLVSLAKHIITSCPRLYLQGLMTIGSIEQSYHASEDGKNLDFETLKHTRDLLQQALAEHSGKWGVDGRLILSMGMSSDFEAALSAGSDIVRVGTGIFGARHHKGEA